MPCAGLQGLPYAGPGRRCLRLKVTALPFAPEGFCAACQSLPWPVRGVNVKASRRNMLPTHLRIECRPSERCISASVVRRLSNVKFHSGVVS